MNNSRTGRSLSNIIWALVQKVFVLVFPFIIRSVIISTLGSEYIGLNSLFTSILSVLSLTELGFASAMTFSMYKPLHDGNTVEICALLNLFKKVYIIIGTIITTAGIILIPFLPRLINGGTPENINIYILYVMYLFNTSISYFLFGYKSSLLNACQRNDAISKITVVVHISLYIFQIIVLLFTHNYYVYVVLIPCSTIFINLGYELVSRKLYPDYKCYGKVNPNVKEEIKKRVAGVFLYKISSTTRTSCDSIFISAFLGLVVLAKYQNYFLIISTICGVLSVIHSAVTASVGDSIVSAKSIDNLVLFRKILFVYMWITGWASICLYCLYQPFMKLWVGESMMLDTTMVTLFALYFYAQCMGDIVYTYRTAAGLWWEDRCRPIIEAIANITLNFILVKFLGLYGIILATIITLLAINFLWGAQVLFSNYFRLSIWNYVKQHIINLSFTIMSLIITAFLCGLIKGETVGIFLVKIIICVVVPNIVMLLLYCKTNIFKESLPFIKNIALTFLRK